MKTRWHPGHRVDLLENGEAFFPRVFEAIRGARREVIVETFILFEDAVGEALRDALVVAARGGATVDLTVDGYGSPTFSPGFLRPLDQASVRVHVFDPRRPLLGLRTNLFRRLHRKLVVVDGERAFVGGINYSADHLDDFGAQAKQDYAVEIVGPAVADIREAARALIEPARRRRSWLPWRRGRPGPIDGAGDGARVAFVTRDNGAHAEDIERHYRAAIRAARRRIVIANAYFLPGYRLLKGLRDAARRGVEVTLILQGHPDMPWVTAATRSLYHYLLPAGVGIVEYCRRPFHGKVALVDADWSTVGSSNLDPLSLWLNLEANVLIRDAAFNEALYRHLDRLAHEDCTPIELGDRRAIGGLRALFGVALFHLLRHFPRIAGRLPAHAPQLGRVREGDAGALDAATPVPIGELVAPSGVELPIDPTRDAARSSGGGGRA